MDLVDLGGSRLERLISDLYEVADGLFKDKQGLADKLARAEKELETTQTIQTRLKQSEHESREQALAQEKRSQEERTAMVLELEKLKTSNEELKARLESFRFQNEQLQAKPPGLAPQQQQQQQQQLSNLVAKEVIDQLNAVHDALKALEVRTVQIGAGAKLADGRAMEMSKTLASANESLLRAKNEVANLRSAQATLTLKARSDCATIFSLKLDLEVSNEQANRLREEVAVLGKARRAVEAELEATKLTIATSLVPLLEQAKSSFQNPCTPTMDQTSTRFEPQDCGITTTALVVYQPLGKV
ncbi:hypothetical protein BASA81_009134 [Batrachochytrium salamandrivorans]|nr:hypothetical protein BASA81_009134 [Batrachochytrium salamandrivorans]